jgi:hypothetical protein
VYIEHPYAQSRSRPACRSDRIGYVVKLQIEKDAEAVSDKLLYERWPRSGEKLLAYF